MYREYRKKISEMAEQRNPILVDPVDAGELTEINNLADLAANVSFLRDDVKKNIFLQGGDGRLFKMEIDYTAQVDEALFKARDLAKTDVVAAVESLNNIEKLTRLGADMKSNTRVVQYMVRIETGS